MKRGHQLFLFVWLLTFVELLGGCASRATETNPESAEPQPWNQRDGSQAAWPQAGATARGPEPSPAGAGASGSAPSGPNPLGPDASGTDIPAPDASAPPASGSDASGAGGQTAADSHVPVGQDAATGQGQDAGGQNTPPEAGFDAGPGPPSTVLDHYVATSDPFFVTGSGSDNLSGITWNPDTGTYFGVIDNAGLVYEIAQDMTATMRSVRIAGFDLDYEAIAYLGGNEFALVRESNVMIIVTITADTTSVGDGAQQLVFAPPPLAFNSGAEAIAFDPNAGSNGRFWVMQELSPMRVFQFDRPADSLDHRYDGDLVVTEPFDPEQTLPVTDISDAVFDPRTGHLLILSHESYRIVEAAPDSGQPLATLDLPQQFTRTQAKWEGIALGPADVMVLASEGLGDQFNRAQIYAYQR